MVSDFARGVDGGIEAPAELLNARGDLVEHDRFATAVALDDLHLLKEPWVFSKFVLIVRNKKPDAGGDANVQPSIFIT